LSSKSSRPVNRVIGIIRQDDRLLLIQRSPPSSAAVLVFSRRPYQKAETQAQALIREMQEELGLTVEPERFS